MLWDKFSSIVREPLSHFLFIGVVLLTADHFLNAPRQSPETISISIAEQSRLINDWRSRWTRDPTAEEMAGIIEDHVREEVLYREALILGLDSEDTIIRRRLAQKMSFLLEATDPIGQVSEDELMAFVQENRALFSTPESVTFSHLFFDRDKRANPFLDAAKALELLLSATGPDVKTDVASDRFPFGEDISNARADDMTKMFGEVFHEELTRVREGGWVGPIDSSFGSHLVFVHERHAGRIFDLDEVRDAALAAYSAQRREAAAEALYRDLRAKFEVNLEAEGALHMVLGSSSDQRFR